MTRRDRAPRCAAEIARDRREIDAHVTCATQMRAMRSYMIKPLALLASRFNEVLLIDHDTYVFRHDLELLFQSTVYRHTGMLIFRDRVSMGVKGQPLKQPGRFVRQV